MKLNYHYLNTPIGQLCLVSDGQHLRAIEFEDRRSDHGADVFQSDAVIETCKNQLAEYFAGERTRFQLSLAPAGTAFQQQVWRALAEIPFGEVRSYSDIARAINNRKAVRAVGAANGRNPLPIVIPCHRVIGSNGSLTGFAGGLPVKRALLALEGSDPG